MKKNCPACNTPARPLVTETKDTMSHTVIKHLYRCKKCKVMYITKEIYQKNYVREGGL